MEKIFIIWHDHDGTYVEEFETEDQEAKKAEERCAEILAREEHDDYGTSIDIIIKGKELKNRDSRNSIQSITNIGEKL